MQLSDNELLAYSRQVLLPQIDIEGQQKLKQAKVLILGLGGLGSPVALYLAAAGVGELLLVDHDQVELSNLQRQIVHDRESIGEDKVASASKRLALIAPSCKLTLFNQKLEQDQLSQIIDAADLVVDCSDNFETRFMLNRICFGLSKPLVSGAAIRWEGQLSTFTMGADTPCYRCLYQEDIHTDQSCAHNGVIAPLVGAIGSLQAMEAIKVITGAGEPLVGRLLIFDGLSMEWRSIRFQQRSDCPVCG